MNPNHDERGRFATGDSVTMPSGKRGVVERLEDNNALVRHSDGGGSWHGQRELLRAVKPSKAELKAARTAMAERQDLDEAVVREGATVHNEMTARYKEAFKRAGAKMWPMDKAHALKKENVDFMVANARGNTMMTELSVSAVMPLTVLDSYPQVRANRAVYAQLQRDVRQIHEEHKQRVSAIIRKRKRA